MSFIIDLTHPAIEASVNAPVGNQRSAWQPQQPMLNWKPKEKPYMTIHLPPDVENSINAQVLSGLFASPDDALAEAWREFIERRQAQPSPPSTRPAEVQGDKPIWEKFADIAATMPKETWDNIPADSSEQLDHYIYGSPRRPAP
jgi:Arc/MetJ-type ribon-helix-helix transcriptional regulator